LFLSAQAAHAAKLAGVVEPRKRRKINYAVHQAASDGDSDYSEDTKKAAAQDKELTRAAKAAARAAAAVEAAKQWKKAEVKALVEGFVTFGEGRTEEVGPLSAPKTFSTLFLY
jgi:multidrug resistance efflux pump